MIYINNKKWNDSLLIFANAQIRIYSISYKFLANYSIKFLH